MVENIEPELMPALKQAFPAHPLYLERQREAFAYTYHSAAKPQPKEITPSLPSPLEGEG